MHLSDMAIKNDKHVTSSFLNNFRHVQVVSMFERKLFDRRSCKWLVVNPAGDTKCQIEDLCELLASSGKRNGFKTAQQ